MEIAPEQALLEELLQERPVLRDVLKKHGETPVAAYARTLRENPRAPDPALQAEFLAAFEELTASQLGEEVARAAATQLKEQYTVSTTDHMGPLTHPFFVHAHLINAAPDVTSQKKQERFVIALAYGNVSLGNSSLPRSLLLHTDTEIPKPLTLHFFPAALRSAPVYTLPAYGARALEHMRAQIRSAGSAGALTHEHTETMLQLIEAVYAASEVLALSEYSAQITKTNFNLWRALTARSSNSHPDLVYLQIEDLVSLLIRKHHLKGVSRLHSLLFDQAVQTCVEKEFEGISGAFSSNPRRGTFLFWYLPRGTHTRIALWRQHDVLVSADGVHRIPLTPESVGTLLYARELIPSTLTCMATIAFYYGVKCLGGFSQVDYLTRMEAAWEAVFASQRAHDPEDGFTSTFCGDLVTSTVGQGDARVPASGIDLLLHQDEASWDRIYSALTTLTLSEAFAPLVPSLHRIVFPDRYLAEYAPYVSPAVPLVSVHG